ncbi:MAG TPA: hypothetical protein VEJ44_05180, partial [Acidimicrobiales bacterium]|nr:hypothetical protein [Acidimicrobiales bacterium]
ASAVLLLVVLSLRRQVQRLRAAADELGRQAVPLVADAHRVVDQAATEMERVGAVLETTESVHATVDSASRLAYRAFANPVVKVLAARAGAATGIRQLAGPERPGGSGPDRNGRGRARADAGGRAHRTNGDPGTNGTHPTASR